MLTKVTYLLLCYTFIMKKEDLEQKNSNYHHGDLKNSLIEMTLEMLEKEGLEKITLRELTQRLGTSRSAIYRHFDSKKALFQGVIISGFKKLDVQLKPMVEDRQSPLLERLEDMGMAYINFAIANPALYRLIMGNAMMQAREENCSLEENIEESGFGNLITLVIQGQNEGLFIQTDPALLASSIWVNIHGISSLIIDGHLMIIAQKEEMIALSFKVLLSGILQK